MLLSRQALGAVTLETTIKATDSLELENISAISYIGGQQWVIANSEKGELVTFEGSTPSIQKLAGDGLAFDSRDISDITVLDEGRLLVSNEGDDVVVIIDAEGKLLRPLVQAGRLSSRSR